jgi:hypothetical protein
VTSRLREWFDYHVAKQREPSENDRKAFKPLTGPVTIVVTELSSPAYDQDGKRYDVILAKPDEMSGGARRPGANADLD